MIVLSTSTEMAVSSEYLTKYRSFVFTVRVIETSFYWHLSSLQSDSLLTEKYVVIAWIVSRWLMVT